MPLFFLKTGHETLASPTKIPAPIRLVIRSFFDTVGEMTQPCQNAFLADSIHVGFFSLDDIHRWLTDCFALASLAIASGDFSQQTKAICLLHYLNWLTDRPDVLKHYQGTLTQKYHLHDYYSLKINTLLLLAWANMDTNHAPQQDSALDSHHPEEKQDASLNTAASYLGYARRVLGGFQVFSPHSPWSELFNWQINVCHANFLLHHRSYTAAMNLLRECMLISDRCPATVFTHQDKMTGLFYLLFSAVRACEWDTAHAALEKLDQYLGNMQSTAFFNRFAPRLSHCRALCLIASHQYQSALNALQGSEAYFIQPHMTHPFEEEIRMVNQVFILFLEVETDLINKNDFHESIHALADDHYLNMNELLALARDCSGKLLDQFPAAKAAVHFPKANAWH